jgi:hypothetical protein
MFNQMPPSKDDFSVNSDPSINTPPDFDLDSLNKNKNFPFKKVESSIPVSEDIFSTTDKQKEYQVQKPMTPRVNTDISNPQVNTMPHVDKYLKKNSQQNTKATSGNKGGFKKIATVFLVILILAGLALAGFWAYGKFFKSKPIEEGLPEDTNLNDVLEDLNDDLQKEADIQIEPDDNTPNPEDVVMIEVKDTDGDKLSDLEEETIGTNPNKVDSDFDGLSDYDEVRVYLTNPVKADSDNDGYVDGLEVQNGYDPLGPGKLNVADETANWKIYTNNEYGFEFKYPNNVNIEHPVSDVFIIKTQGIEYLQIQYFNTTPQEYYEPNGANFISIINLGGKEAKKYYTSKPTGEGVDKELQNIQYVSYVIVLGEKKWVQIEYYGEKEIANLFDQIISTFKFTK